VSSTITGSAAKTLRGNCRAAQMGRLRAGAGAGQPAPGDAGYQEAVDYAVSAMNDATAQCHGSATSPIAEGDAPEPPDAEKEKDEKEKDEPKSVGEIMMAWFNVSKGTAEIILSAAEIAHDPAAGLAKTAAALVSEVGTALGLVADGDLAEKGETAAQVADVAQAVLTVATVGAETAAAELALPVAGLASGGYAAYKLTDKITTPDDPIIRKSEQPD
jgi:hypothetical protein